MHVVCQIHLKVLVFVLYITDDLFYDHDMRQNLARIALYDNRIKIWI